jgi:hypothetical protein
LSAGKIVVQAHHGAGVVAVVLGPGWVLAVTDGEVQAVTGWMRAAKW